MRVHIRSALASDELCVAALWKVCGLAVPQNNPEQDFRLAACKENSDILLVEAPDKEIIGSVLVGHDGHRGWIYYVAVLPNHRRNGVGTELLKAANAWLVERGVPKAQLMIRETNAEVAGFYERSGFVAIPRIVMQKVL